MTLVDDISSAIDVIRGIPDGDIGVRPHTVTLQVSTWSGSRIGLGTETVTETELKVGGGTANPKVVQVSQRDAIASGGQYSSQDLRVGPFTPSAVPASVIDPAVVTNGEVRFLLTGPGLPSAGALYRKVGQEVTSATKLFIVLSKTGQL